MLKIGIVGYGNLGKAVEREVKNFEDIKLVKIFSRRDINKNDLVFERYENITKYKNKIDVMIMCGGSASDLMWQSKEVLKDFCIIDSFDTHKKILTHFKNLNKIGKENKTLAMISCGWDPGLFSMMRLLFSSLSKQVLNETFWGKGISQGHSDAIRKIEGVLDARQYTIPKNEAIKKVRSGNDFKLTPRDMHRRECFVVLKNGINPKIVEEKIKNMPYYFDEYDTTVHFVSQEELNKNHSKLFHSGFVFSKFKSQENNNSFLEFSLKLESNPDFTASVLLMFSRALKKMKSEGKTGAITVFDVPLKFLSNLSTNEQMKML